MGIVLEVPNLRGGPFLSSTRTPPPPKCAETGSEPLDGTERTKATGREGVGEGEREGRAREREDSVTEGVRERERGREEGSGFD